MIKTKRSQLVFAMEHAQVPDDLPSEHAVSLAMFDSWMVFVQACWYRFLPAEPVTCTDN